MANQLRAFRVELDLTVEQMKWCQRACAASRVTYNWGLGEWKRWYRWEQIVKKNRDGRAIGLFVRWAAMPPVLPVRSLPDFEGKPSAFGIAKRLTQEKKASLGWLHELNNAYVVREAIGALGTAYAAFFRRLKKHRAGDHSECGKGRRGKCSLGAPRFHARRPDEGFICNESKRCETGMDDGRAFVTIPGLGRAYAKAGEKLPTAKFDPKAEGIECTCGRVKGKGKHKPGCSGRVGGWTGDGTELCGVGIRRWGGRWYASVRVHADVDRDRERQPGKRVAVEVGVRYRAVTYDGARLGAFADTRKSIPSSKKVERQAVRRWIDALCQQRLVVSPLVLAKLGELRERRGRASRRHIDWARRQVLTSAATAADGVLLRELDAELAEALPKDHTHGTERIARLERKRKVWERRQARRWKNGVKTADQSHGWHEARAMVAKLHREIAQYRADRIHFVSRAIVNSGAEEVVTRDMRVKEMLARGSAEDARARNALADDVQKAGMSELLRQLEYKQKWAGGKSVEVGANVPETKTCMVCGAVRGTAPGYPWFSCASCGHEDDRDANAAMVRHAHKPEAAE